MQKQKDMRLLKGMRSFLMNVMNLIIKALSGFIRKQDLLKRRERENRLSCGEYCNRTAGFSFSGSLKIVKSVSEEPE